MADRPMQRKSPDREQIGFYFFFIFIFLFLLFIFFIFILPPDWISLEPRDPQNWFSYKKKKLHLISQGNQPECFQKPMPKGSSVKLKNTFE